MIVTQVWGEGVTGDVTGDGGGGWGEGRYNMNQLNIEYHTEIDDCYTGLGVTGDVGGVGGKDVTI